MLTKKITKVINETASQDKHKIEAAVNLSAKRNAVFYFFCYPPYVRRFWFCAEERHKFCQKTLRFFVIST